MTAAITANPPTAPPMMGPIAELGQELDIDYPNIIYDYSRRMRSRGRRYDSGRRFVNSGGVEIRNESYFLLTYPYRLCNPTKPRLMYEQLEPAIAEYKM